MTIVQRAGFSISRQPEGEMREERLEARNGDGGGACGHPSRLVTLLGEVTDEEDGTRVADRIGRLNHADLWNK